MLTRLFVIFGGLFVLVLLAALVVPPFVDWTGYRADFEREASAILGRKVTVHGEATARLLPFPSVTFSDVSVDGGSDGQPAMTVETFSMDAELAPFLRGEVLIFDMRLVRPRAAIDIAADGTVDWAVRPSSPFDPAQVSIEKLTITEGQVTLRHAAGGKEHLVSEIDAVVSARSLAGPWRLNGSLRFDGMRARVSATTGKADGNGRIALRIAADPDGYPFTMEADGTAGLDKGLASYSGQFRVAGNDRNAVLPRGGEGQAIKLDTGKPAGKAEPGYRVRGKFTMDHRRLAIEEFRFETGPLDDPYAADGTASLEFGPDPRFAIEASGAQVQFDEALGAPTGAGLTLAQRLAALETALVDLPRPVIPGSIEVRLPAVVAGDTTIRDVHLSAEPAPGGWKVKAFSATLPGRATLEADGMLSVEGQFGFSGSLLLAVGQPSGFAAWLSKDVDEAIRRLPAAGFKAKVEMTDERQSFSDMELILGTTKFTGRLDAAEPADIRPSVTMRLEGGELDVAGLTAFASIFVSDKGDNRFASRDLDFQIRAGPVDAWGLTANRLDSALRLRQGILEIDRLSIEGLAGASISATGRIRDFPDSPTGELDASVVAVDLAPLIETAAGHYPDNALLDGLATRAKAYPELFHDTRIDFVASATDNGDGTTGLALSAQGDSGGSAFSASLSGQGRLDRPRQAPLRMTFSVRNSDAAVLLALCGLPALPLGMLGEATAELSAKGSLAEGLATRFSLTGAAAKADFDGMATFAPHAPALGGRIGLEAADIEPWLMTMGVALPGMGTGTALSLSSEADYGEGLLALSGLDGAVNEVAVSGDVNAVLQNGRPHLSGALAVDELDLGQAAAMLLGAPAFAGDGHGWPATPFASASGAPFSADLDLSAGALSAGAFATAYDASLSLKLDAQGMRGSGLRAKFRGGALAGLFDLKNSGGTGLFSGQMALSGADLTRVLPDSGLSGTGDFSAELSTSGKSVDAMISALSGSGTASLKGLTIAHLNQRAFPALIAEADRVGRDIDAASVAGFAPGVASGGSFAAADTDAAFTIAGGTLRVPSLGLENPAATLTSDLAIDLAAGTVAVQGTLAYRPGDEALVGSDPVVNFTVQGPLGAAIRSFDTQPLAQFLTQRALEKEQQRVEDMQAALLEKQRLRREAHYYQALQVQREKAEADRRRLEEERARAAAAAQIRARAAEDEARKAAEQEKARQEAERKAAGQASGATVERKPLPPPAALLQKQQPPPTPVPKLEPSSIQEFLESLQ